MPVMTAPATANGQAPAEKTSSKYPYIGLNFFVEIDGVLVATFAECSSVTAETEVFEYAEGGLNTQTHKLPVRTKYGNITLKRGIDEGQDLFHWYMATLDGKTNRKKKNMSIKLYTSDLKAVRQWDLIEPYPVKWTGPDLKADAGAVAVETMEIAFSRLSVTENPGG